MKLIAPAKINLWLSVGPRRADGLHELVSVMQAISLADEILIEQSDRLSITVDPPAAVPADDTNTAARAARAFAGLHGREPAVAIHIRKHIPVAAGLAGGSADAAAVLVGLNRLWDTAVSRKALERIGAGVGADVPFCVRGGTALVRGAGEDLGALHVRAPLWWVVAMPDAALSTAEVYAAYDRLGGGELGDPFEIADALARDEPARVAAALHNDLERAALSLAPQIAAGRDLLVGAGALGAVMSGSGPAWLGLAPDEQTAHAIATACAPHFRQVTVARSLDRGPRMVEE